MMPKKSNEMTTREAAEKLGVHIDTIVNWAKETIASAGQGTRLEYARIDVVRKSPRYYVDAQEIARLATSEPTDNM